MKKPTSIEKIAGLDTCDVSDDFRDAIYKFAKIDADGNDITSGTVIMCDLGSFVDSLDPDTDTDIINETNQLFNFVGNVWFIA